MKPPIKAGPPLDLAAAAAAWTHFAAASLLARRRADGDPRRTYKDGSAWAPARDVASFAADDADALLFEWKKRRPEVGE